MLLVVALATVACGGDGRDDDHRRSEHRDDGCSEHGHYRGADTETTAAPSTDTTAAPARPPGNRSRSVFPTA